jgi:hypothetical protein
MDAAAGEVGDEGFDIWLVMKENSLKMLDVGSTVI